MGSSVWDLPGGLRERGETERGRRIGMECRWGGGYLNYGWEGGRRKRRTGGELGRGGREGKGWDERARRSSGLT